MVAPWTVTLGHCWLWSGDSHSTWQFCCHQMLQTLEVMGTFLTESQLLQWDVALKGRKCEQQRAVNVPAVQKSVSLLILLVLCFCHQMYSFLNSEKKHQWWIGAVKKNPSNSANQLYSSWAHDRQEWRSYWRKHFCPLSLQNKFIEGRTCSLLQNAACPSILLMCFESNINFPHCISLFWWCGYWCMWPPEGADINVPVVLS